jgi:hypothetical protein
VFRALAPRSAPPPSARRAFSALPPPATPTALGRVRRSGRRAAPRLRLAR